MTKIKRGGFIFLTWTGDHTPHHVHVYQDERQVLKWDLEMNKPMAGTPSNRLLKLIQDLVNEGLL